MCRLQSGCNSCCSRVPVYETQYLRNFLFTKAKLSCTVLLFAEEEEEEEEEEDLEEDALF
jgi:hypothetical protein